MNLCLLYFKTFSNKIREYQQDLNKEEKNFLQIMKGEVNFSYRGSSLNDISLYSKQKKVWIHRRKVLNGLCSLTCIVPF